jgi:hypothetical protein
MNVVIAKVLYQLAEEVNNKDINPKSPRLVNLLGS